MNNYSELIDRILQPHLQQDISLQIGPKIIRTGKFILYNFYDFHIELAIIYKNKIKKLAVPIPFNIEHYQKENLIYFDYRVKSLYKKFQSRDCDSKYYNSILEITFQ